MVSASFLMMMIMPGDAIAQKEDKIRTLLKASDIKKIEHAEEYRTFADKLMEEANQLSREASSVKSSTELVEKEKKKKVRQLEKKNRQKITAASDYLRECNQIKYSLYKTYIEKFWLRFEGDESTYKDASTIEEQSNDLFFQAITDRAESKMMPDGHEKIQKLKQAIENENLAIDKQLTLLGLYYGIDLTDKGTYKELPFETPRPGAVEPTVTETVSAQIQSPPLQTMESQPVEPVEPGGIQAPVAADQTPVDETPAVAADKQTEIPVSEPPVADVLPEQKLQQPTAEQQITAVEKESQPSQNQPDVEFRIQVAASRTPLTREKMANLCSKSYTMGMTEENGWYRYHIVAGNSYEKAKKILRECGVEKAFIVPFKNGKRVTIAEVSQTNP
jgi:hypothetical protein